MMPPKINRGAPKNKALALASLLMSALVPMAAQAIDVDAGDFVPAPEGTTTGLPIAEKHRQ